MSRTHASTLPGRGAKPPAPLVSGLAGAPVAPASGSEPLVEGVPAGAGLKGPRIVAAPAAAGTVEGGPVLQQRGRGGGRARQSGGREEG